MKSVRWVIVDIVIGSLTLLLTLFEVSMFIARDLHPTFYLTSCVTKIVMSIVPLGYNLYTYSEPWSFDKYNIIYLSVAVGFAGVLL